MTQRVRVPGTTSNLGPGFDCLGAALSLHNEITVDLAVRGEAHPMVDEASQVFCRAIGVDREICAGAGWSIRGEVPISRGLGSSVTLRLGILAGLNGCFGERLSRDRLFELCSQLEGHPDNAGPAVYGGFFTGAANGARFRFPIDETLRFVLLVPEHRVLTEDAREVLPKEVTWSQAVANVGNAAAIVAAFASRDYDGLRGLFFDYLHQPYRGALNPGLEEVVRAGEGAGAYGGFLSGSGSTIACLAPSVKAEGVARAMEAAYTTGPAAMLTLPADNEGFRLLDG